MDREVKMPWIGGLIYHGLWVEYTMDKGFDIPGIGDQNSMGRGFDMGGGLQNTMGRGFKIPWIGV